MQGKIDAERLINYKLKFFNVITIRNIKFIFWYYIVIADNACEQTEYMCN